MINSFFKPPAPRSYAPYFVNRPPPEPTRSLLPPKGRKARLLILLLSKSCQRVLREHWDRLWHPFRKESKCLARVVSLADKSSGVAMLLAFERIKRAAAGQRAGEKALKSTVALLLRLQKYKLKQSFGRLVLFASRQNDLLISTFFERRDNQFFRRLVSLFRRRRSEAFGAVRRYAKFVKSHSKVRVIAVIYSRAVRSLKQAAFGRLLRSSAMKGSNGQIEHQVQELKLQLQDMTVQLENKNDNIQRLEDQIEQIKVEQSNASIAHNLTYGDKHQRNSRKGSFRSCSAKRLPRHDPDNKSVQNYSSDNLILNDLSIGSLLGNLNRSRYGSSKFDASCECTCGLKSKYLKYKTLNESLKNQLDIVKEELEVAKDLNEHFTNEIKQYLTEGSEGDFESLKREHRLILDERDQLREKVFKYQKQISNLKSEFKFKMQELYRKVKKGNI